MIERSIEARTHGRFLLEPSSGDPAGLLVGFHGYAEAADAQMERMRRAPGVERWVSVAIQGLHRFYQRRTNEVVASWMTRQDRELAIADNLAYVASVVDAVAAELPSARRNVFCGFSQGVAMTFRAACDSRHPIAGVISVGGDVPPELEPPALARVSRVLICRGTADQWYTAEKFNADLARLRAAGVAVQPMQFDGGHEWSDPVVAAAAEFLAQW